MSDARRATRLETEALVIGYAMSRLDTEYFRYRNVRSWQAAYQEASQALDVRPGSIRNLRDEFDPFHDNGRQGWHKRPILPSRQRVLEDLRDLSDDALMALVDRVLLRDEEATAEAVDSLAAVPRTAQNVAERLLTGRRVHIELVARGIRPEGREHLRAEGLRAISRALTSCPLTSTTMPGRVAVHVFGDEGSLHLSLELGPVSVEVVIRADERTLAEGATWMVVDHEASGAA